MLKDLESDGTLPYVRRLAAEGVAALNKDPGFAKGINTYQGHLTCRAVAQALNLQSRFREFTSLQ